MKWDNRILWTYRRGQPAQQALPVLLDQLIAHQQAHWPLLHQNLGNLALTETRTLALGRFDVVVQCNPGRMQNTTARVDQASVQQRRCKLCVEQLFDEQRGVAYGDVLVALCNPYPILNRHLSIVDRTHVPQAIKGRLPLLLDLAQDVSRAWALFYNGPRCGASTPEHFHVQAVAAEGVPVLRHYARLQREPELQAAKQMIWREPGCEVFTVPDYHVRVLVYQGTHRDALTAQVERTIRYFARLRDTAEEPLLNLLLHFTPPTWTIYLFPRARHRPAWYYDNTLTVSPATLDMAGCLVVPMPEQFRSVQAEQVRQVFTEVSLEPDVFTRLTRAIAEPAAG